MNTITVSVTQDHIDQGTPGDNLRCPIALALTDVGIDTPSVAFTNWRRVKDKIWQNAPLTRRAQKFITRFDEDGAKAVRPTTFRLQLP